MDPLQLPIRKYQKEIAESVKANPVTVVIGETGSGKTTQISQILEEAGFADDGLIGVTQPRRVVRRRRRCLLPLAIVQLLLCPHSTRLLLCPHSTRLFLS